MSDRSCIQLAVEIERRNYTSHLHDIQLRCRFPIDLLRRGRDRYRFIESLFKFVNVAFNR